MNAQTKVTPDPLADLTRTLHRISDEDKLRLIDFISGHLLDPDIIHEGLQQASLGLAMSLTRDADEAEYYAETIYPQGNAFDRKRWEKHGEERDRRLRYVLTYRAPKVAA